MSAVTAPVMLRAPRQGRRAATLLEFVLILPIFLFFMVLTVNLGLVVSANSSLQQGAFMAARQAAQTGFLNQAEAAQTITTFVAQMPGTLTGVRVTAVDVGGSASASTCDASQPNDYIQIQVTAQQPVPIPGLSLLMDQVPTFTQRASAVARCEVSRL